MHLTERGYNMDFKSGDVVLLKSGSPAMTIESIGTYSGVIKAKCIWFDGTKKYHDLFELSTLEKYE